MSRTITRNNLVKLIILAIFLLSCSEKTTSTTLQPQETKIINTLVPSTETPKISLTETLIPLDLATSTPTLIIPTPTPVNWDELPALTEVALSKSDFEKADSWYSIYPLVETDATNELEDLCLWDCAKFLFSNSEKRWTVVLLRAGDNQKALSTAQNLKANYKDTYEYTPDVLKGMLPDSWIVIHKPADRFFISATIGVSYGRVVLLITASDKTCFYTDEGLICEGDLYSLADDVSDFAKLQIKKLADAGYPK